MAAIAALPALDDLRDRALTSLASCGVAAGALDGDQPSVTPILAADWPGSAGPRRGRADDAVGQGAGGIPQLAAGPSAGPRRSR